ncbi:hypothetical protein ACIODS_11865 [Micromonospora chalcea]|uniref:hypothetical protein n=1 Tax=Micromonospora chalcea TaxID=1874 RepID=UPI00380D224F
MTRNPDPIDPPRDAILFPPNPNPTRKATPRQAAKPRYRHDETPLRPGDVVAVGLDNGRCPVGQVEAVSGLYFRLNLYSWPVGRFTAGTAVIRHGQVREFSDLAVPDGDGVYQMDPLAAFQTRWTEQHQ